MKTSEGSAPSEPNEEPLIKPKPLGIEGRLATLEGYVAKGKWIAVASIPVLSFIGLTQWSDIKKSIEESVTRVADERISKYTEAAKYYNLQALIASLQLPPPSDLSRGFNIQEFGPEDEKLVADLLVNKDSPDEETFVRFFEGMVRSRIDRAQQERITRNAIATIVDNRQWLLKNPSLVIELIETSAKLNVDAGSQLVSAALLINGQSTALKKACIDYWMEFPDADVLQTLEKWVQSCPDVKWQALSGLAALSPESASVTAFLEELEKAPTVTASQMGNAFRIYSGLCHSYVDPDNSVRFLAPRDASRVKVASRILNIFMAQSGLTLLASTQFGRADEESMLIADAADPTVETEAPSIFSEDCRTMTHNYIENCVTDLDTLKRAVNKLSIYSLKGGGLQSVWKVYWGEKGEATLLDGRVLTASNCPMGARLASPDGKKLFCTFHYQAGGQEQSEVVSVKEVKSFDWWPADSKERRFIYLE